LKCCKFGHRLLGLGCGLQVCQLHLRGLQSNKRFGRVFLFRGHFISRYYTQPEVKERYIESRMQLDPYRFRSADIWLEGKVKERSKERVSLGRQLQAVLN
jgi:hypothetical protein